MELIFAFLVLGVSILIMWGLWRSENEMVEPDTDKIAKMYDKVNLIEDFNPSIKIIYENCAFAFDEENHLLGYVSADEGIRVIPFSKIVDVQLEKDGQVISRHKSFNTKGAIVGGVLAGGLGATVGGIAGAQENEMTCKCINIHIRFSDIKEKPIHECLYTCIADTKYLSVIKTGSIEDAYQLEDILLTIIANNKMSNNN